MKRLIILLALLGSLAFVPASSAATIGGTNCGLNVSMPGIGGGWWQGDGTVSCPTDRIVQVQVCVQDLVTGGWSNYSCWTGYLTYSSEATGYRNFYPYQYSNRYWRVWAWGNAGGYTGYTWGAERYL